MQEEQIALSRQVRVSSCLLCFSVTNAVRTPSTAKIFADYRAALSPDLDVVKEGGWYALELKAVTEEGRKQLATYQEFLPKDFDVEAAGGTALLEKIAAADPKQVLVQYMADMTKRGETATNANILDAVTALLHAQGKGYDDKLVGKFTYVLWVSTRACRLMPVTCQHQREHSNWRFQFNSKQQLEGDWLMVMQRQGNKSPSAQQFVGKAEKAGKTDNTFDTKSSSFYTAVRFWRDRAMVDSTVEYTPVEEGASVIKGTTVPRRIMCDITSAGVKFFRLPRIPLKFLQRKGGYLDFVYLDEDIRVTRGNRGGLFFHGRPAFVEKMLAGQVP